VVYSGGSAVAKEIESIKHGLGQVQEKDKTLERARTNQRNTFVLE